MATADFHFTAEQKDALLRSTGAIHAEVPEANRRYVILPEDDYDHLRRALVVDEVDLPFFDCEEIDSHIS